MIRIRRAPALVPLLMATLFGLAGASTTIAARHVSPRAVVLQPSEVPHGFFVAKSQFVSARTMAQGMGISKAALTRRGFINSFEVDYQHNGTRGILFIESQVTVYRSAPAAAWGLRNTLTAISRGVAALGHVHYYPVRRIGDYAIGLTLRFNPGNTDLTLVAVAFRHGPYIGSVALAGLTGKYSSARLLPWTRLMESRT